MKWNFRFLDLLLLLATALVGWNLQMTTELIETVGHVEESVEVLSVSTDLRLEHLEDEKDLGKRFTFDMGETVKGSVRHNRDMFQEHIRRTEPRIEDIHDAVVPRMK
jgi:hypothetical protein